MHLIYLPQTAQQAQAVQQWFALNTDDYALVLEEQAETPTARELRKRPELCLIYDEQGLWLAANGMKMQPDWVGQLQRLYRAGIRNELLARACLISSTANIIDATAGLGHDALLLAWLGASVTMVERHPILAALLMDAKAQAIRFSDERLHHAVNRMTVVFAKSEAYLVDHAIHSAVDVVYLDPMFPKAATDKKQPLVKKEMQILQHLLSIPRHSDVDIDWGDALLPLAMNVAKRVVVKRPRLAEPLAGIEPAHRWLGDACRFDGYFQHHLSNDLIPVIDHE
ncbi:MAG: class I SAM-dependent methyltransferase [Candidatus Saccharibacteria bacterium]|nr:class I SAM-dependent methyltransferase [Moraxellaceae bacterium]